MVLQVTTEYLAILVWLAIGVIFFFFFLGSDICCLLSHMIAATEIVCKGQNRTDLYNCFLLIHLKEALMQNLQGTLDLTQLQQNTLCTEAEQ